MSLSFLKWLKGEDGFMPSLIRFGDDDTESQIRQALLVSIAGSPAGGSLSVSAIYNDTPPTLSDGDVAPLQADESGNLKVVEQQMPAAEDGVAGVIATLMKPAVNSMYSSSGYQNLGAATKDVIKNAAGNLYAVRATNENASARYLQVFNKASAPTAGVDTPLRSWKIPAGTANAPGIIHLDSEWFSPSEYFGTGIAFAISTTKTTFTDSATASEHEISARYK